MVYILNIGYRSFAFASSRGLQTVMDVMSKAVPLEHAYFPGSESDPEHLATAEKRVEISMHVVNGVSFVKGGGSRREVIEPEVMPRQRPWEGDALFALRALKGRPSAKETAEALTVIRRDRLAADMRRMLGEARP